MTDPGNTDRAIPDAMTAWSRTVFGAPRRIVPLITNVEPRDEVIERVFSRVLRRTLTETRVPSFERSLTRPVADPATLDPFAFTTESLRVATQHVVECASCRGSGTGPCGACHASGITACRGCGGDGKQRSEKTGRPIKCKLCKGSGRVTCGVCSGGGSIACQTCSGSGRQLAWSVFVEDAKTAVAVEPLSPTVKAHPSLVQHRALDPGDVVAFSTLAEASAEGPIDSARLPAGTGELLVAAQRTAHPRSERVVAQQYLKLAVVRRDVSYEMCGTSGTVSLSGHKLVGATTPDAVRPIRRRLRVWAATTILAVAGLIAIRAALVGSSAYFAQAQSTTAVLVAVGSIGGFVALGGVLRAWRGGLRFRGIGKVATVAGVLAVAAGVAIAALGLLVRPSLRDAETALAAGRIDAARAVVEALREQGGNTPDVADADDRITLASVGAAGTERDLPTLDRVAARGGKAAPDAATRARDVRRRAIDQRLAAGDSAAALRDLDAWFPEPQHDPDAAAARARAHEVAAAACANPACRYTEASRAASASPSAARETAKTTARGALLAALAPSTVAASPPLAHVAGARSLRALAASSADVPDPEVQRAAAVATSWADAERAKTSLIGASPEVAAELLGGHVQSRRPKIAEIALDGGTVYFAVDAAGTIHGAYVTGAEATRHEYQAKAWPPDQLLAQAVGHKLTHPWPSPSTADARWYEGGVPIVVRWSGSALVELRIGDAAP